MKFYQLKNKFSSSEEIGKYPQAESLMVPGDIYEIIDDPKTYSEPLNTDWILPEPILIPEAKPTTALSVAPIPETLFLIVKEHFLEFLEGFNIGRLSSRPILVHYNNKILNGYKLLHLSFPSDKDVVDYPKSDFLIGKLGDWRDPSSRKPLNIKDHENYLSLVDVLKDSLDNSEIRCNKLVLDFSNVELDLVRLNDVPFGSGYYVSERLKDAIENESFTGFEFVDIGHANEKFEVISGS